MTELLCLAVLSSIILVGCRVAQDVSCAGVAIKPCFGSVRAVYGIGWQCRGGDVRGGVAEWFGERIAGLIVTVEAVGLLDCVIISGDYVS